MASDMLAAFMKPSLDWFLVIVPISVYLEHFHFHAYLWIFFPACVAIIPLAGLLGEATEHIAEHAGEGIGGVLNATFGNAAELIIAIVGNAAEHSTAVLAATKNRMDLSFGIAIGNSTQIALFVAPLLVFLSYIIGPQPMDLVFTRGEVLAVILSTFTVALAAGDGRSNWFMGAQLLAVYLILAVAFYFMPG
jgi:Ca2+:H+ antiporter